MAVSTEPMPIIFLAFAAALTTPSSFND
jgi:hypothetical protein